MPNVLKKVGLAAAVIVIYFLGIREVRQEVHDFYMGTILPEEYGEINNQYSFYSQSSVSFTICSECSEYGKGWLFKVPFGSFWLFGAFALVLISAKRESYLILSAIHLSAGILTFLFVLIGKNGFDVLMIGTDFISRYLLPLFSLGYVALVIGQSKTKSVPDE